MLWCFWRSGGRELSEIIRLCRGTLLRSSLLVQNLQACPKRRPGLHQAQEERHSWLGDIPALWLRGRPVLQNAARRWWQGFTESAHVPETLNEHSRNFLSPAPREVDQKSREAGLGMGYSVFQLVSSIFSCQRCRVDIIVSQRNLNNCSKLLYYTVNNIRQLALKYFCQPCLKEDASVFSSLP